MVVALHLFFSIWIIGSVHAASPQFLAWDFSRPGTPAENLVFVRQKDILSPEVLLGLQTGNLDLSLLEIPDNSLFKNISFAFPMDSNTEVLQLENFSYQQGQLVLAASKEGEPVKLVFGGSIFAEIALAKIHRELGYRTRDFSLVQRRKLYLGSIGELDLVRAWVRASKALSYDRYLSRMETDSRGNYVWIHVARMEQNPMKSVAAVTTHSVQNRREVRALGIVSAWLQNLRPQIYHDQSKGNIFVDGFSRSLGNTGVHSSVNLFRSVLVPDLVKQRDRIRAEGPGVVEIAALVTNEWDGVFRLSTPGDIRWMLRRMLRFTEPQLQSLLKSSGYPEVIAQIYASKLLSRLESLVLLFGVQNQQTKVLKVDTYRALRTIQHEPYVKSGVLLQNFPGFQMDLMRDSLRNFLQNDGAEALRLVDQLASEMIAHAPFVGMERSIGASKFHMGPGWVLRVERNVRENPDATGPHDLFEYRDKFQFTILVGFGVGGQLFGATSWISAAPGWTRRYMRIGTAPTFAKAKGARWMIPYNFLVKLNFSDLKPGETFAIRDGLSANIVAGGNIRIFGQRRARNTGYALGGFEGLWGIQVKRRLDGMWNVITEDGTRRHIGSKLYLRLVSRLFRIPIAHIKASSGSSDYTYYTQDRTKWDEMSPVDQELAKHALNAALDARDIESVAKYFQIQTSQVETSSNSQKFNLYKVNGTRIIFGADEELDWKGKLHWLHKSRASYRVGHRLRSGYSDEKCNTYGILEFVDASRTTVKDLYLDSRCNLMDDQAEPLERTYLLRKAELSLGDRLKLELPPMAPGVRDHLRLKTYVRVPANVLRRLFSLTEEDFDQIVRTKFPWSSWIEAALWGDRDNFVEYWNERHLKNELRTLFAAEDWADKMDRLVEIFSRGRSLGRARFLLVRMLEGLEVKASLYSEIATSKKQESVMYDNGIVIQGSARKLLGRLRDQARGNLLHDF